MISKHPFLILICVILSLSSEAQELGDAIVVETFNYSQTYGITKPLWTESTIGFIMTKSRIYMIDYQYLRF